MHWFGPPKLLLCFTFLALCLPAMGRLAVMSIDLGGEFMKIAIVKPGVPMEIALNKESSRKTRSIVAFRDGERHFINDAYNTAVRFPSKAFWYLSHIIGRSYDDPMVQQFRQRFPYYTDIMVKDEDRGTVLFKVNDDTFYSTEELMGMLLEKAREYAQDFAEQTIKDAVITIPPYYNQAERRAIMASAELVGINVLQLMTDSAAVALNYGVFRRKNFNTTAQYYMFYDMGATSTVATVVSYQVVKVKEGTRVESNPQLSIKGVGYDRTLGGLEMTLRLRDHLVKVFNGQKKRSFKIEDNPRAMAKLLKEAERVKKVLSANTDHKAQVEGLVEGEDFAAKVSREDYLDLIKDLLARVTKPMEDALKVSEITMPEISEIILMGGGSRVPRVQEELLKFSGKSDLGKSINTDEAAALGAVYQAAYLGKGFKVKTFHVRDANIYPINVEFEKQKSEEDTTAASSRTIKRTLFGRMNPYPQRKVMTFNKHFKDFNFEVRYADLDFMPEEEQKAFTARLLSNVSLEGVESAYGKLSEEAEYKGVKAHFRMDESGILHLEKVESVFEKQQAGEPEAAEDESTWSKIGNAFGGLFGGKEGEKTEEGKTETTEEEPEKEDKTEEPTDKKDDDEEETKDEKEKNKDKKEEKSADEKKSEDKEGKDETKKEEKEEKTEEKSEGKDGQKEEKDEKNDEKKTEEAKKPAVPKTVIVKENITSTVEVKDIADLSSDQMKESKKKLSDLQKKDQEKVALEKAKNELEGFIFDMQDKLTQETYEACSTEEERTTITQQLSEASDWLYEQPDDAKKEVFIEKLKEVKDLVKNIQLRVYEKEERPKALAALKHHLNATQHFLKTVYNMTDPEDPMFTPVELATLEKLINDTTAWRDEALAEQAKVPDHQTPTLLVENIGSKIYALEREMKYLINKAKNYRPKPKTDKTDNSTSKANKTKSDSGKQKGNKTKTIDEEAEEKKEEAEDEKVTIEDEDDTTTTTTPESQEASPDTESSDKQDDDKTDDKDDNANDKKEEKSDEQKTESKKKESSKKRRPKKKRDQEEVKTGEEEILELGSDDTPTKDNSKDSTHEEL